MRTETEKLKQSLASKTSSYDELAKKASLFEARYLESEERLKASQTALASEKLTNSELLRRVTELETERISFQARWAELKNSIQ